ncbi:transmembrane transport [Ascochyta rabiei]|uniref:Transmembrane transport n=1 Tax=Didymella rabiei TaxID=5454 RepID=A0A163LRC1_DIDRA|nr:transmembrane transport [Ascochyta rabiei]
MIASSFAGLIATGDIILALLAFFLLPDHPPQTRWLSAEERQQLMSVLQPTPRSKRKPPTFQSFLPTVVRKIGYKTTTTLALTCPPYFLAAIMAVVMSNTSGRYNERTWHIAVFKGITIPGFIIPAVANNIAARMVAIFISVTFSFGINKIMLG